MDASADPFPVGCWLMDGRAYFASLEPALAVARTSIRLEAYIVGDDSVGRRIREALTAAARRRVRVTVLVDGLGSAELPSGWWDPLTQAGGLVHVFNPPASRRIGIRDHRKLVVIDETAAWVGGVNLAQEYDGDGVDRGWADCGFRVEGGAAEQLAIEFDLMVAECAARQPKVVLGRMRRGTRPPSRVIGRGLELMVSGPGRLANAFQKSLRQDVAASREVQFAVAYFLPGYRMRQLLRGVAARGTRVQILVPGRSDVAISHRAARHLYASLMKSGVEIWEYQPQVLHVKLFLANRAAYVGSSNLDTRSLHINYELMLRLTDSSLVTQGQSLFSRLLERAVRIDPVVWTRSRSWLERLRDQWAFWILSRADPYVTRWLAMGPR